MNLIRYLILALVQGLTEFLPISSSGHLVFLQQIFNFEQPLLSFDIMLHLATSLSVIIFLRSELALMSKELFLVLGRLFIKRSWAGVLSEFAYFRLFVFLVIAFLPAVVIGLLWSAALEQLFVSLKAVGGSLLFTGLVLYLSRFIASTRGIKHINFRDALFIGLAQAIAIIPGISRSGLTIASGMFRGLDRNLAAKFSFLLSLPTILAAAVYKLKDIDSLTSIGIFNLLICFFIAFSSGCLALKILSRIIAKAKFHYFAFYCWMLGVVILVLSYI